MIPKVIHYTWFSGEKFPDKIQHCINSWLNFMPDWEFRLWDMESIKGIDSMFLKEALSAKKWAFASDFVRLYAIYHYGGIYLDTDVLVLKSLEPLLNNVVFIGREQSIHIHGTTKVYLSSHCFGAESSNPYIYKCLQYYDNRHFITSQHEDLPNSLKYSMELLPFIQSEIAKQYGYNDNALADKVQFLEDLKLKIYPSLFFDDCQKESFCSHLALGAWRDIRPFEPQYTLRYKIEWRLVSVLRKLLQKFDYIIVKLQ